MTKEDKIKLCRIVGVLVLSDGRLEDQEVDYLQQLFERLELSAEDQEEVMQRIESSTEVLQDAADLAPHAETLLAHLKEASMSDEDLAPEEDDLIKMVREALDKAAG